MGGHQVPGQFPAEDGFDEEGYDESQRAEILEFTRDGPSDGVVLTDLQPDLGDDDEAGEDELDMTDDELGEEDDDASPTASAVEEDEIQEAFEDGAEDDDENLDDASSTALEP
jgi:DNA-directed RNA polymerase subunit delta